MADSESSSDATTVAGGEEHNRGVLAVGELFAGHVIEGVAGSGGMGTVYRARDLHLDRVRAIKVIAPELSLERDYRERFRREARLAAQVEHPNLLPIHRAGEEGGLLYLVTSYVDGADLAELIRRHGRLDAATTATIAGRVAAGLDAAHGQGLVHRDVKPANVLVADHGQVFLTDFGIARKLEGGGNLTASGDLIGTVDYVAPEQIEGGSVGPRADVYSLGCVLFEALTGAPPFRRKTRLATLIAHADAPRPRVSAVNPSVPSALDAVLARAMAPDPEERPRSAGELSAEFAEAAGGRGSLETVLRAPRERERPRKRSWPRRAVGALAAGGSIVLVGIVLLLGGGSPQSSSAESAFVAASADVGGGSTRLAVGEDAVWVPSREQGTLHSVALATGATVGTPIELGGGARAVAVGFGSLWVIGGSTVWRVDPDEREPSAELRLGPGLSDIAAGAGGVWVTNERRDELVRIDPRSLRNQEVQTVRVGEGPRAVAVGSGAVWVANVDGGSISRIDPRSVRRDGNAIRVGGRPADLAVGADSVWVVDNLDGRLIQIDSATSRSVSSVSAGVQPRGVAVGLGAVWVVNGGDDQAARFDPERLEPLGEPVEVGDNPADVRVGGGAAWVVNAGSSTLSKIELKQR